MGDHTILFENLPLQQAEVYHLVLSSGGIMHSLRKGVHGWQLVVNNADYERAVTSIVQYNEENPATLESETPLPYEYHRTFSGVWIAAILLAFYLAMGNDLQSCIRTCGSSAFHVLHGEPGRIVTSLFIHTGVLHLAGNMLGIGIFGTAVCMVAGTGVGSLMMLVTGMAGNAATAFLYQADHVSVGASTTVFGAVGILAAHQFFRKKFRLSGHAPRAWLPLGGGVALLAVLGSGENADLLAHLFGFAAGVGVGFVHSALTKRPAAAFYQVWALLGALLLVLVSWMTVAA